MKYTPALGDKICKAIAKSSIGLRLICKQLNIPYSTVTDWVYNPEHELHKKYLLAKQMQLHVLAEEVCTMVDDLTNDYMDTMQNGKKKTVLHKEHISRTRLRMQARIAIITKLAPALYGTKPPKTKHKVIMPEPPHPSAPAPKPALNKRECPQDTSAARGEQPTSTFKYFDDGTYEEYNEKGDLIRKSMPRFNPKPHHQGFW